MANDDARNELATIQDLVQMAQRRFAGEKRAMATVLSIILAITRTTRVKLSRDSEIGAALLDEFPEQHDVWSYIVFARATVEA